MRNSFKYLVISSFLLFGLGFVLVGCMAQPTTQPTTGGSHYGGVLDTSFENALEPLSQLALGTLRLQDTPNAVTPDQAARLLPLWQALQNSIPQNENERNAVLRQIESMMTSEQMNTIAGWRLDQAAMQAWNPGLPGPNGAEGGNVPLPGNRQGGTGGMPQGMTEEQLAQMRAQAQTRMAGQAGNPSQNLSDSERATRRAQFGSQAGSGRPTGSGWPAADVGAAGGSSTVLVRAVVTLLSEKIGPTPQSTTVVPAPTATSTAAPTATPTATPTVQVEPATATPTATPTVQIEPATATPTATTTPVAVHTPRPTATPGATATPAAALVQVPDTDPGPPLTIQVSLNQATQDPLVEASKTFKITGLVRNDGTQTYDVSAIRVTFFNADGFRGTFQRANVGRGGEWVWSGQTKADFACLLLAPGESCPFSVEITAQNMASFLIHPDATATSRESLPVELSGVKVIQDSTNYVRITGTATNKGTSPAQNVTVVGTLVNAGGQIVSVGSVYVLQSGVAPGASVSFDLRIPKQPYARYQLYAQAERDGQ